jgi:signal transduction histidine kinase
MSRARIGVGDWAIAVGVAAILLVTGLSGRYAPTRLDLLGYALLTVGALALAARRLAPVPVLAVAGLCAVGYQAAGFDVPAVAYLFAVYAAVRAGHRTVTVAASVIMLGALPLAAMASGLHDTAEAFARARGVLELAWLIAAGAAGEALRQAERRADEAERTREETARRRADEERLHIARELHDSLTQQTSVIKVRQKSPSTWPASEAKRSRRPCWRSGRPVVRRPGNCEQPWRRCATRRTRYLGSTTSPNSCNGPGRPAWTRH